MPTDRRSRPTRNVEVKRTIAAAVTIIAVLSGAGAAAVSSAPLVVLVDGAVASRLVALEPVTLDPRGSLALPGTSFGREWARSPDRSHLALVPKPVERRERLFVIDTRARPRVVVRMRLPHGDVCRLAWPQPRSIVVVLTRKAACYSFVDEARMLVIDPRTTRMVARGRITGRAAIVATAPTPNGLAFLLQPAGRRGGPRLVLASTAGTRVIRLPRLQTRPRPLDKSLHGSAAGLAVEGDGTRAFVLDSNTRVIEVNLASAKVDVHRLTPYRSASAAKATSGAVVQALAPRPGVLALTGIRRAGRRELEPAGLRLVDTHTWRSRLLDNEVTGIAVAETTILAFQPSFDELGGRTAAIGLRAYSIDGFKRFGILDGSPVVSAATDGRYAYVTGRGRAGVLVVDLTDGRVEEHALSISPTQLLAGASSSPP
jgi:hypothetical protein